MDKERHLSLVPETKEDVKAIVDYHIRMANYLSDEKSKLQILYDAAEGIIDNETYKYVLNPLNTDNEKLKRFPAKLRNYDIIKPVLNSRMGEAGKQPHRPIVTIGNEDALTLKKDAQMQYFAQYVGQDIINHLNSMGVDTGQPSKAIPGYDELNKKFDLNYNDHRAKRGQGALDYIYRNQDLEDKRQEAKWHWLVGGRYISYKDVAYGDVTYEICDPRDIVVTAWGNTQYVEDADAVVYTRRISPNFLLENWRDDLEQSEDYDEIVDWVLQRTSDGVYTSEAVELRNENITHNNSNGTFGTENMFNLYQVVVKLVKKVGVLTYTDPDTGQEAKMPVDGKYKIQKEYGDISVDFFYVDEVWSFYQIEDKWIFGATPHPLQRNEIANVGTCKLPFNGRILGYNTGSIWSVVKAGLNYQVLTNIFMYRLEHTIAKNKDKMVLFPLGLIPDGPDWGEDKFMYMAEALGFMFWDETSEKAAMAIQGVKEINLSFGQFIDQQWNLIANVKQMYWDEVGMNRQRIGDTYASDGKANTEQAIFRAAIITFDEDRQFDKTFEKDYQGLLDASKIAYANGKKAQFVTSEASIAWFEMTPDDALSHMESEYNVFVKNTSDEYEKLNLAKSAIQTMGQNGLTPDGMIEVIAANNIAAVKEIVKANVRNEREFQQQMQEQQGQQAQQLQQLAMQNDEADRETKRYVADKQYQGMVEAAAINADADLVKMYNETMAMYDESEGVDNTDVEDAKARIASYKQSANERQHGDKVRLKEEDQRIKREQMNNAMKIAKENKN
jgi:hypothetical protein